MTTLNIPIAASADDAIEATPAAASVTAASGLSDATNEWQGLRFVNVTIPSGATINTASVSVVIAVTSQDEPNHPIYGNDVDDAAAFSAIAGSVSGRTQTTATVTWSSTDLGATGTSRHDSPDLSTIVQEIIDRGGWASGNAMAFMIQGSSDASRDFNFFFYDNGSLIPEFDADYTAGGGGGLDIAIAAYHYNHHLGSML